MFHEIATGKPYVLPQQKEDIEKPSGPTVTGIFRINLIEVYLTHLQFLLLIKTLGFP